MRKAVFLDRDDTLIANERVTAGTSAPGDLFDPRLVELLPGVGEGLARLAAAGYALVVVTNQGGVAQGLGTMEQVEAVNDRMREVLGAVGVRLAGVYYSPARPDKATVARFAVDSWGWRKPRGGMVKAAAAELGIDLAGSWMIGDAPRDVEAACAAGMARGRCVLVGTAACPDFSAAVARVLG